VADAQAPMQMSADGEDSNAMLARFAEARVDVSALATKLQVDGAAAFVKSWHSLLGRIESKARSSQ
jgi:transaldolase